MITVVGNLKGGCGKSTVAFNLAVWLARHDQPLNVLDLDPQRTLADTAEVRTEEGYGPQFKVQAGGPELLASVDKKRGEYVIDVGTADMVAMCNAIALADRVLIPVPPSQADIWSTQRFLQMIVKVSEGSGPEVRLFVNRADTHQAIRESDEAEEALSELAGVEVMRERLCQRTAYRRSFSEGMGVFELSPRSKAAGEFAAFGKALYPELA